MCNFVEDYSLNHLLVHMLVVLLCNSHVQCSGVQFFPVVQIVREKDLTFTECVAVPTLKQHIHDSVNL